MKLYTIKFANGLYLRLTDDRPRGKRLGRPMTSDISDARVHHRPEDLVFSIEGAKDLYPEDYKATLENGGGSYKLIEVKISEVEDETNT